MTILRSLAVRRNTVAAYLVCLGVLPAWGAAYIRVNQIGYASGASKRAYLMASGVETGATFSILSSSGVTVYGPATIGANVGSWSSSYPDVYALDFDGFVTAGTYTISVNGPIAATSPSFKIDSATNLYSTPLANSLYFYENERDGLNYISSPLRTAPGHLNDESATVYFTPTFNKRDNAGTLTPPELSLTLPEAGGTRATI